MRILKILKDKDLPKIPAKYITNVTVDLKALATSMLATMQYYNGVGLAGPQVGENVSILVFDCINISYNSMDSAIMFNPEILESSEEFSIAEEGCLSYPKIFVKVKRSLKIKVKYIDIAGRPMVRTYKGLAARIIQHEVDHLNAITMLDRAEEE
jgi:peptide deformylase